MPAPSDVFVLRFKQPDETYLYYVTYPGVTEKYPSGGAPPVFSSRAEDAMRFASIERARNLKGGDARMKDGEVVALSMLE